MPIEHLVVLMLENRSFDHILGFYRPAPGGQAPAGLTGNESNAFDPFATSGPGSERVAVSRWAGEDGYITDPGPQHEHADAMVNLFGTESPAPGAEPTNAGFLSRYASLDVGGQPLARDLAARVMGCFDTAVQLPALQALAESFVILDHWFSSLPGPTWPNRFFAHCATSGGHFESPTDPEAAWSVSCSGGDSRFGMPTIFESLAAAGRDFRVYYHDIPQALALSRLHAYRERFFHYTAFVRDAQAGTLPAYTFIEPAYFAVPVLGLAANDMHPSHDVRRGDALIADVYGALRASPLWASSALLVLWDEHGGFYDHVPPPMAVCPDAASDQSSFDFRRLGVRVPALLASPWVDKGVVDSSVYDHASIPATVKAIFGTKGFLSKRDAAATPFESLFCRAQPRMDTPLVLPSLSGAKPPTDRPMSGKPISDNGAQLVAMAASLPGLATAEQGANDVARAVMNVARYLDV